MQLLTQTVVQSYPVCDSLLSNAVSSSSTMLVCVPMAVFIISFCFAFFYVSRGRLGVGNTVVENFRILCTGILYLLAVVSKRCYHLTIFQRIRSSS